MNFSVDVFEELIEKEVGGWNEKETKGYMVITEGDFNVELDIQELEKLLEESEYNELIKEDEETPRRGHLIFHDRTINIATT